MTEQKWISVTTDVGYQAKCVLSAIPETMIQITGAKLTPQGKQYTITVSGVCAMIPDQQAGSLRVITTYGVCSCPVIMTVSGSSFSLKGANGGAIVFDPLEAGMGVKGRIEIVLETTYPYSPSAKYTGASLDYGNLADLQFSLPKNPLMGHVFTATPKLAACYEDCHVKLIIEEIPEGKKGEVLYREEFHWDPKTTHKERCSLGFGADTHSLAYAQKRRDKAMQVRIYGGLSKDGIAYRDILQYGTYTLPMPSLDSMSLSIQRKWVQQEEHLVFFVSGAVSGIAANAPFSLECQVVWNGQNRSVLFNVQNSIQYSLTETGTFGVIPSEWVLFQFSVISIPANCVSDIAATSFYAAIQPSNQVGKALPIGQLLKTPSTYLAGKDKKRRALLSDPEAWAISEAIKAPERPVAPTQPH